MTPIAASDGKPSTKYTFLLESVDGRRCAGYISFVPTESATATLPAHDLPFASLIAIAQIESIIGTSRDSKAAKLAIASMQFQRLVPVALTRGRETTVTVYARLTTAGTWESTVSFSSLGEVGPDDAMAMSAAIQEASFIARRIAAELGTGVFGHRWDALADFVASMR